VHDLGHLARVGGVDDGGWPLVEREVEAGPRGVVPVVAGERDSAAAEVAEGRFQFIAGRIDDRPGGNGRRRVLPRPCPAVLRCCREVSG
jgi:hypothetical protein